MESHVAPKNWILSMDGWRKVTLRDLLLTITSICSTRKNHSTGISLKNINGSFLPQHYTILMELIKNANFSILKQRFTHFHCILYYSRVSNRNLISHQTNDKNKTIAIKMTFHWRIFHRL